MKSNKLFIFLISPIILGVLFPKYSNAEANLGATACESFWYAQQPPFNTLPRISDLESLERHANRGNIAIQYRLGMVEKTLDEKWKASDFPNYNNDWLEKAIKGGSKSAAYELEKKKWVKLNGSAETTYENYINALKEAAEEEGNPWAATSLMEYTNNKYPLRGCYSNYEKEKLCSIDQAVEMLPASGARKWAEIAAEGGNPAAQEWLCRAAINGASKYGQEKDDKAAYKWCLIATHNACSYYMPSELSRLYKNGIGVEKNEEEAKKFLRFKNQPWRSDRWGFFYLWK